MYIGVDIVFDIVLDLMSARSLGLKLSITNVHIVSQHSLDSMSAYTLRKEIYQCTKRVDIILDLTSAYTLSLKQKIIYI